MGWNAVSQTNPVIPSRVEESLPAPRDGDSRSSTTSATSPLSILDRLPRPTIALRGRAFSTFRLCGYTGLAAAWLLALALITRQGLPLWPMTVVALGAMATFLLVAVVTRVVSGRALLVYYHHEIAIIAGAALTLRLLDRPVLPYLDAAILGVGAFLAFGRIGCFLSGCCHGRPARAGVRYGAAHAAIGFPSYLTGVRLIPVQLLESAVVFAIVAIGARLVWTGHPPGTALVWYVVAYDLARFLLECLRGDLRPDHFGFSSPQWLSLALTLAVVVAGWFDLLPTHPWQSAAAAALILTMTAIALDRRVRSGDRHRLLHPHHLRELALALTELETPAPGAEPPAIPLAITSRGLVISRGQHHDTISTRPDPLTVATARAVARLIEALTPSAGGLVLHPGRFGSFHLVEIPKAAAPDRQRSPVTD